ELKTYPEMSPMQVVGMGVRRYWDMVCLAKDTPCKVIGETGIIRDKPGFEVDLITRSSATSHMHSHDRPSVLMPMRGHWRVTWEGGETTLAPGDTMSVPENLSHTAVPSMTGEASLYHIVGTDDPAGPTWQG
ncbi:MAG: cupin, partial [Pseudomonadota bacterium]